MKILIIGCGSIGQRHMKNLITTTAEEIIAYRTRKKKIKQLENDYNVKTYLNLTEALDQNPDAVLITNPTSLHIQSALAAAMHGCHLFIEKPISNTLDGIDELINIVHKKKLVVLIGCNLRFHPCLHFVKKLLDEKRIGEVISARVQMGQYLPDWHPWEDYRTMYSSSEALGGGIILDAIHELDYIKWLLGDVTQVFSFSDKLSNLEIDTEDVAEILLRFRSGAIAEVHLDYIQRFPSRSCEIIGEEGSIVLDIKEGTVKLYTAEENEWKLFEQPKDYIMNQSYIDEMLHFINCIKGKEEPLISIVDGLEVLKIALAAKESAKNGVVIKIG
ncbi:MAG: Gfo/Idh/MocA family oxidoreductase [Candidatus Methanoperedens sp.]